MSQSLENFHIEGMEGWKDRRMDRQTLIHRTLRVTFGAPKKLTLTLYVFCFIYLQLSRLRMQHHQLQCKDLLTNHFWGRTCFRTLRCFLCKYLLEILLKLFIQRIQLKYVLRNYTNNVTSLIFFFLTQAIATRICKH